MNKKTITKPLDKFDRAILRIVQKDNKTPQRQIADIVHLSAAAVQRRIAAMEKSGIIKQNSAVLDVHAVDMNITAIVEVHLRDERIETVDLAKNLFKSTPEVQQCYYVTGGISFVLIIVTADVKAYEQITRRIFAQNDFIAKYRSLITLDRVKSGSEIVIP
ncbi:winged helix-turn-helix transcriptional regulator [Acetobacter fabarum]|jgi:DNA-binding Lrp family transcriptional regulator|uniref:Lrp/AsnC family transcriptional regulator n=1 Tax=Acetobacter fabarum TaxID=483199 RepID=UPI0014042C77|nr:Lrp/AsnC family transcriptional regulator [Acetobacter fabarum]MCH4026473.1 Lrp/AsnC family transcriptional regulator [Acetobacter fabarum]MCH4085665.1 Lrp/AsnC family transcriptional regulator [Acetobacter fabarum]MCH4137092.1 Lrp/AsnC family transcriptional regulator [Acetobacter fabarum]MCI1322407.1 Lrp/AsnC family transcriptional regulator [Acetobacter fabarum]NHO42363.1 winged helix-turn-helix transcriptional regulator [Acetobacter fabarum]